MNQNFDNRPIGVLDSGIGGMSTLCSMQKALPHQQFVYATQSTFQPFGNLDKEAIYDRAKTLVDKLVSQDCKAIVIACNTATNVGIGALRRTYNIPFVGLEPALRPAVLSGCKKILTLVTPSTAKQDKFLQLVQELGASKIIISPQPNLATKIEETQAGKALRLNILAQKLVLPQGFEESINSALQGELTTILQKHDDIDGVVLGCTHYVFLSKSTKEYYANKNQKVQVFDGNAGATNRLIQLLTNCFNIENGIK